MTSRPKKGGNPPKNVQNAISVGICAIFAIRPLFLQLPYGVPSLIRIGLFWFRPPGFQGGTVFLQIYSLVCKNIFSRPPSCFLSKRAGRYSYKKYSYRRGNTVQQKKEKNQRKIILNRTLSYHVLKIFN